MPSHGFAGSDRFWYFVLTARGAAFEVVSIVARGAMPPTEAGVDAIAASRSSSAPRGRL